eukprot:c11954_g1_i1.p1 GENE.c11954_g1_i1~~c11954_g1_i1.p1  ORF type:complete len:342 (+),score=128.45 c11954_g1_i1:25-1050(+)
MADRLCVVTGTSNPALAKNIAKHLGIPVCNTEIKKFSDGETSVQIEQSVRGKHVFVVQSISDPANDTLMEILLLLDACKRASAGNIVLVIPYFGYARQSIRRYNTQTPVAAKLVADLVTTAGAHRILTLELHTDQIQGFFNVPLDHLQFSDNLTRHLRAMFPNTKDLVIVAAGKRSTSRAKAVAEKLSCSLAVVDGRKANMEPFESILLRRASSISDVTSSPVAQSVAPISSYYLLGDVRDKVCILMDDIIDSSKILTEIGQLLKDRGAKSVVVIGIHGIFSEEIITSLLAFADQVICSNSVSCEKYEKLFPQKMIVLDSSILFAEAIRRIHFDQNFEDLQ